MEQSISWFTSKLVSKILYGKCWHTGLGYYIHQHNLCRKTDIWIHKCRLCAFSTHKQKSKRSLKINDISIHIPQAYLIEKYCFQLPSPPGLDRCLDPFVECCLDNLARLSLFKKNKKNTCTLYFITDSSSTQTQDQTMHNQQKSSLLNSQVKQKSKTWLEVYLHIFKSELNVTNVFLNLQRNCSNAFGNLGMERLLQLFWRDSTGCHNF